MPVFIPALAAILFHHEHKKNTPLSEDEVISIRDHATVMMMPQSVAKAMDEKRGYRDINPEFCWLEWRLLRMTLTDEKKA